MPNDAKLGLVLGMGLVVLIGLVFFRKDSLPIHAGDPRARVVAPKTPRPQVDYPTPPPIIPLLPVESTLGNPFIEPPPPIVPPAD